MEKNKLYRNPNNSCCCNNCDCCGYYPVPPAPSAECCCKNSTFYTLNLLKTILSPTEEIQVNSFNKYKKGAIDSFLKTDEIVVLTSDSPSVKSYVSICNIALIRFDTTPPVDSRTNCNTPECCCNAGMDESIRTLLGNPTPDKFPIDLTSLPTKQLLQLDVVDNTNAPIDLQIVYGICNGIIWGKEKGNGNRFVAIPLCYIFSANIKKQ